MATVGDLAEIVVQYQVGSAIYLNVFGFRAINIAGTFSNLASGFKTALVKNTSGGLLEHMMPTVSCSQLTVNDVVPGTSAPFVSTFTPVVGATGSGEQLPPQSAIVLSWKTALKGRSFRGRTYLPGYGEIDQNAGVLGSSALTAANTIVTQMLAVYGPTGTDANWQFGVISRIAAGVPRITPIFTAVTSGAARSTVFTQRRRTLGVGM